MDDILTGKTFSDLGLETRWRELQTRLEASRKGPVCPVCKQATPPENMPPDALILTCDGESYGCGWLRVDHDTDITWLCEGAESLEAAIRRAADNHKETP